MKREYDFRKAKRGPVVSVRGGKTRITIRIDDDILAWFREQAERAGGGNYQTLINEILRQHVQRAREPLEKTLRRVIREELRRASWFPLRLFETAANSMWYCVQPCRHRFQLLHKMKILSRATPQ
jgi:hypothetical protein